MFDCKNDANHTILLMCISCRVSLTCELLAYPLGWAFVLWTNVLTKQKIAWKRSCFSPEIEFLCCKFVAHWVGIGLLSSFRQRRFWPDITFHEQQCSKHFLARCFSSYRQRRFWPEETFHEQQIAQNVPNFFLCSSYLLLFTQLISKGFGLMHRVNQRSVHLGQCCCC